MQNIFIKQTTNYSYTPTHTNSQFRISPVTVCWWKQQNNNNKHKKRKHTCGKFDGMICVRDLCMCAEMYLYVKFFLIIFRIGECLCCCRFSVVVALGMFTFYSVFCFLLSVFHDIYTLYISKVDAKFFVGLINRMNLAHSIRKYDVMCVLCSQGSFKDKFFAWLFYGAIFFLSPADRVWNMD